jgi:hypothetical protein
MKAQPTISIRHHQKAVHDVKEWTARLDDTSSKADDEDTEEAVLPSTSDLDPIMRAHTQKRQVSFPATLLQVSIELYLTVTTDDVDVLRWWIMVPQQPSWVLGDQKNEMGVCYFFENFEFGGSLLFWFKVWKHTLALY